MAILGLSFCQFWQSRRDTKSLVLMGTELRFLPLINHSGRGNITMNMKIHTHRPRHILPPEKEILLDEVSTPEKQSGIRARFARPIPVAKMESDLAEHAVQGSLSQQIDQHRARLERQQQIRRSKNGGFSLRFTHIEQLSELLEGDGGDQQAERENRIRDLLEKKHDAALFDSVMEEVDRDPASAYATLSMMAMRLQDGHQPAQLAKIQGLLDELQEKHGAEVAAGVNTAQAFALHSTNREQKKTLRKLYYDGVVGQQSSDSVLDMLLSKFGAEGFIPALKTLQRALADDIAALAPSIPPMALRRLMSGLNDTSLLSNTINEVTEFLNRIQQSFGNVRMSVDTMTRSLLGMCRNGFYSNNLITMGLETVGEASQQQPFYFNHLLRLVQRLPENVWGDNGKHRDGAIKLLRALNGELAQMEKNRMSHAL